MQTIYDEARARLAAAQEQWAAERIEQTESDAKSLQRKPPKTVAYS